MIAVVQGVNAISNGLGLSPGAALSANVFGGGIHVGAGGGLGGASIETSGSVDSAASERYLGSTGLAMGNPAAMSRGGGGGPSVIGGGGLRGCGPLSGSANCLGASLVGGASGALSGCVSNAFSSSLRGGVIGGVAVGIGNGGSSGTGSAAGSATNLDVLATGGVGSEPPPPKQQQLGNGGPPRVLSGIPVEGNPEWAAYAAPDGRTYYYNASSGISSWDKPPPPTQSDAGGTSSAAGLLSSNVESSHGSSNDLNPRGRSSAASSTADITALADAAGAVSLG